MVRSLWKGKFTSGDFCDIKRYWIYIPLAKFNIYTFSHFKNIKFSFIKLYEFQTWKLLKKYIGFTLGVFFFNREINVIHTKKKTKKQKEQEKKMQKKNKITKSKKKLTMFIVKKKKKKN